MTTKYKQVRMPLKAYQNLIIKKIKMESDYKKLTGKNKRIPMTRLIIKLSENPIYFYDNREFIKQFRRKI